MKMAESSRSLSLNKKKVKRYFFVISLNVQISAKYEVWKILLRGKYYFLFYFTDFHHLNLTARFYEHFNI